MLCAQWLGRTKGRLTEGAGPLAARLTRAANLSAFRGGRLARLPSFNLQRRAKEETRDGEALPETRAASTLGSSPCFFLVCFSRPLLSATPLSLEDPCFPPLQPDGDVMVGIEGSSQAVRPRSGRIGYIPWYAMYRSVSLHQGSPKLPDTFDLLCIQGVNPPYGTMVSALLHTDLEGKARLVTPAACRRTRSHHPAPALCRNGAFRARGRP